MHCIDCGKKLSGAYNKCHKCQSEYAGSKHYCPSCGGGNHKTAKSCHHCGRSIEHDYEHILRAPSYKPKKRIIAAILALFLGAFGIHDKYLGFSKRARQKLIWFCASVAISISFLFMLRANFDTFIYNGMYDAAMADAQAPKTWFLAIMTVCGAFSAFGCIIVGFFDCLKVSTDKSYTDSEGQLLV